MSAAQIKQIKQLKSKTMSLSYENITDIQTLYRIGVPKATIARHFNVTPPTITYYTKGIPVLSIDSILDKLNECGFIHPHSKQQQA